MRSSFPAWSVPAFHRCPAFGVARAPPSSSSVLVTSSSSHSWNPTAWVQVAQTSPASYAPAQHWQASPASAKVRSIFLQNTSKPGSPWSSRSIMLKSKASFCSSERPASGGGVQWKHHRLRGRRPPGPVGSVSGPRSQCHARSSSSRCS